MKDGKSSQRGLQLTQRVPGNAQLTQWVPGSSSKTSQRGLQLTQWFPGSSIREGACNSPSPEAQQAAASSVEHCGIQTHRGNAQLTQWVPGSSSKTSQRGLQLTQWFPGSSIREGACNSPSPEAQQAAASSVEHCGIQTHREDPPPHEYAYCAAIRGKLDGSSYFLTKLSHMSVGANGTCSGGPDGWAGHRALP
ncbi:hypothetical protein TREES_T100002642 [Tupaia chinensis]|uniref:Uncharacterized protein n=1 Tax=Tupaia chinensis TaxID=246437 RepID=L9L9N1_TUPCH|nr:hypothetical protein TREES_T100002642 [Tupaia chinensis]